MGIAFEKELLEFHADLAGRDGMRGTGPQFGGLLSFVFPALRCR